MAKEKKPWIIRNVTARFLFWNHRDGWSTDEATHYTQRERDMFNLPIDGEWINLEDR